MQFYIILFSGFEATDCFYQKTYPVFRFIKLAIFNM